MIYSEPLLPQSEPDQSAKVKKGNVHTQYGLDLVLDTHVRYLRECGSDDNTKRFVND
jgi:hypothetical protein